MRIAVPFFVVAGLWALTPAVSPGDPARASVQATIDSRCGAGTLDDDGVCVHLPTADDDGVMAEALGNLHRDRQGRWSLYDQIPRRPDRPESYDAYRYPIPPGLPSGKSVISGYDLDRPDGEQRRGRRLRAVGHGGLDLPQSRGTPIKLVALEHQQGDAEVIHAGALFGTTVVTRHAVRESGQLREYIVLFGHLDAIAPGVQPGTSLKEGDVLGTVGDSGSPELVHLHLETRRVREGVDLKRVGSAGASRLTDNAVSIVCDPRNVLPLREPR